MGRDVSTAAWTIGAARRSDLAFAHRVEPTLFALRSSPDVVLAASCGDVPVGIAAVAWRAFGRPAGFPLWIHVEPSMRRRGVGRDLARAAARVCEGEIGMLHAWHAIDPHDAAAAFARAVGFAPIRQVLHFEADGDAFMAAIAPLHERLRRRGSIPSGAMTIPFAAAPHAEVASLVSDAFGSRFDVALAATRQRGAGGYDRERSVVLVVDGRVGGALLYRWNDRLPSIDVNVVAPSYRGGWANVLLLHDATRNGLAGGARSFRFHCEDTVRDTRNLARRAGARLLRTSVEWAAPLDVIVASQRSTG